MDNPNGIEQVAGLPFFWIGGPATVVRVATAGAGEIDLAADVIGGPSRAAGAPPPRLRVSVPAVGLVREVTVAGGAWTLRVPVAAGATAISLEALDAPTVVQQTNGDRRPLLIGVSNLRASSPAAADGCR